MENKTPVPYSKEERRLRKELGKLIVKVRAFEAQVDTLFALHDMDANERGKQVAKLLNSLTFANDSALYFGLRFDHERDTKDSRMVNTVTKWAAKMWD